MATVQNEWLEKAWDNECRKDQVSLKREAEEIIITHGKEVKVQKGYVEMDNERYENWKEIWKKLKRQVKEETKNRRKQDFKEKKLQSKIPTGYTDEDHDWLKCNTDPREKAAIFNLQ